MANIGAIRSVGISLTKYLKGTYDAATFPAGVNKPECSFEMLPFGRLTPDVSSSNETVQVMLHLYRVTMNEHLRTSGRPKNPYMNPVPLSVDLHYLFSFWSSSAENEQVVLAWTMRELHFRPVLDRSILSEEAAWEADDILQLIPDELTNEDLMRIWEALDPGYQLSLSYIARVVRIDPDDIPEIPRVVATRFDYHVPGDEGQ